MDRPDFIIIPKPLLDDGTLQSTDKELYGYIYWLASFKNQKCRASNSLLAQLVRSTPKTVGNALQRLEEHNYIKRVYEDPQNRRRSFIIPLVGFSTEVFYVPFIDGTIPPTSGTKTEEEEKEKQLNITINKLIAEFKPVNPSYQVLFQIKAQRDAIKRLLKTLGEEKLREIIMSLPETNKNKFAPVITTPYQLEQKLGKLLAFLKREKERKQEEDIQTPEVAKLWID